MTNNIHPTAILEKNVELGDNIKIGPYAYISGDISISDGCDIAAHVVIEGSTKIGKNNVFFPFSYIGGRPQDLKFHNEKSLLEIGDNNVFRENTTIHSGTELGNKDHDITHLTRIGSNCLFMVGSHVAHDCVVADNVILANNATLGGHVSVEEYVIIGGLSAVKQFIRIGKHAIIGGMSGIESDIIPYSLVMGERANIAGINLVGLKRRGFSRDEINDIKQVYDLLFANNDNNFADRVDNIATNFKEKHHINQIVNFILSGNNSAICKPKQYNV